MSRSLFWIIVCLVLKLNTLAFGANQCTLCYNKISEDEIKHHQAYVCSDHHCVDRECLAHQIKSEINPLEIESVGLPCCGVGENGEQCHQRLSLSTIRGILEAKDRDELDSRIAKAQQPTQDHRTEMEIFRLVAGIEQAFNLCCPATGCGGILDRIEGCNAATCSDESCKATFCYLCLKPQADSRAAHEHARGHSDNYWENRPGFTQRYHWQISRKELSLVFKGKIDSKVKSSALEVHKKLLEERNFWPMPAGMKSALWVTSLMATPESPPFHTREKKIELLQNEYIFLTHEGDWKNAEVVKSALKAIGGPVFASLDVSDGAQPVLEEVQEAQDQEGGAAVLNPGVNAHDPLVPVLGAERVDVFIPLGEEQYRVGNLIWSSAVRKKARHGFLGLGARAGGAVRHMSWYEADRFCRRLGDGARLPTILEYEALRQAMGGRENYRADMVPDMRQNKFWSSSPLFSCGSRYYFYFNGDEGFTHRATDRTGFFEYYRYCVRCVREVQRD